MSGSTCFFYASGQCVIFSNAEPSVYRPDSTRIQPGDIWIDVNNGMIRTYKVLDPPGFTGWQPMGVMGDSQGDVVNFDQNVALDIIDLQAVATAYPHLCFKSLDPSLTTVDPKYTIVMNNGILYFRLGSVTGSEVMRLDANGDVRMTGNLTVVGDLFADDVSYDVNQCNTLKVADDIVHVGNETNKIAFLTDKMTLDASGTSIVLDDTLMTNNVSITGSTQFINNIDDVPDIYLRNHVHHFADINTRMGFPSNDTIALRTGGVDRVTVTDATTTVTNLTTPQITLSPSQPRIFANMNGGTWDSRLIMQTTNSSAPSKLYILPSETLTTSQSGSTVYANRGDLNAATYNLFEVGQYPTECRNWTTAASGDPLPFVWRYGGSVERKMEIGKTTTIVQQPATGSTAETPFKITNGTQDIVKVDGRGGLLCSSTGLASPGYLRIQCDSGSSDAYFVLSRNMADKWFFRNVQSDSDKLQISPDTTAANSFYMHPTTGAVSIGQSTESYKFCVNSGSSSGCARFLSDGSQVDMGFLTSGSTRAAILAATSGLGSGYGDLYLRTRNNNTITTAVTIDGTQNVTCSTSLIAPRIYGVDLTPAVSSPGTGLYVTSITAQHGGIWSFVLRGNPNNGGSGLYLAVYEGRISIRTGYNGSAVTSYIDYTSIVTKNADNVGSLVITPYFYDGAGNYYTNVNASNIGNYTISVFVSGYASAYTNANAVARINQIL